MKAPMALAAPLTMTNTAVASEDLLHRVRGEYLEMPGLWLTPAQAARLWGVEEEPARVLLEALVATGFLIRMLDGRYRRPNGP